MIRPNEISFVLQGAVDRSLNSTTGKPVTQSSLESLRTHYPQAEVILSTWQGQDVTGLEYDVLVENEDPGGVNCFRPSSGVVRVDNMNRQIVSSKNGLLRASGKYAVKLRSDLLLGAPLWMEFLDRYPARVPEWKIFQQRIVTCSLWTRDPRCPYTDFPYHPSDWIHAGLADDVRLLWDIPLQPQPESAEWFFTRARSQTPPLEADLTRMDIDCARYYPEQYLWTTLLRKFGNIDFEERSHPTEEDIRITELSFANNLIILNPDQIPLASQKYAYPDGPTRRYYRLISHKEWERLYLSYCADKQGVATLKRVADPDFYLKWMYIAAFKPLQKVRERAVAAKR